MSKNQKGDEGVKIMQVRLKMSLAPLTFIFVTIDF